MDCSSCKARHNCMAVVEPGSIACMAHLLQAGGTKADGNPYQTRGDQHRGMFTKDRAKNRAKTFPGIAHAMAEQWGTE